MVTLIRPKYKVNKLEVLEYDNEKKKWKCKCECGNIVYKRSWDIKNGKASSCGKCVKGGGFRREILENKNIGNVKVLKYLGDYQYEVKCNCGRTAILTTAQLHKDNVSCGCKLNQQKRIDLTNKIIGKLTVLEYKGYEKYECKCECGNIETLSTYKIKTTASLGCTECTNKAIQERYDKSRIDLMHKRFGSLTVIGFKQDIHKWVVKCDCGKVFDVYGQHLRSGDTRSCGCKFGLNNSNYRSYLEIEINDYIRKIYKGNIINNHRGILPDNKEIDIYLPELKMGIEVNGTYWHNSDYVNTNYHKNKVIEAYKNGVELIHIYEYEWRNNQVQIENYLKNKLLEHTKIYARKTIACHITTDEAREFCEIYHLQGYVNSSIKIGLKYENEIIAVMTFGTPRFNKEYDYELLRLAFKNNVSIIGGSEKLFKYFLHNYNPQSIISYCNIDKFKGKVYTRLGFNTIKLSNPNYVWINKNNVLTRYQTQKQKLTKLGLGNKEQTEDEIMKSLNYVKLYDSGNLVLEYINKEAYKNNGTTSN